MQKKPSKRRNKLLFSAIFILSTTLMLIPLFIKDILEPFTSLGLISIAIINFISSATIFLPSPGIVSVAVGGNLYNPFAVAIIASIGASLGELISYLFGFSSRKVFNNSKHKFFFYMFNFIFNKYAKFFIPIIAFIPNPIIDGLGIFAGLASYSWKKYLFLVFAGRLGRNLLIAQLGIFL